MATHIPFLRSIISCSEYMISLYKVHIHLNRGGKITTGFDDFCQEIKKKAARKDFKCPPWVYTLRHYDNKENFQRLTSVLFMLWQSAHKNCGSVLYDLGTQLQWPVLSDVYSVLKFTRDRETHKSKHMFFLIRSMFSKQGRNSFFILLLIVLWVYERQIITSSN